MCDFTEDEVACLKKMIYKFRQDEILNLYAKRQTEEFMYRTTISGGWVETPVKHKSFLDKVKDFFNGMGIAR